jgi:PEGA domain
MRKAHHLFFISPIFLALSFGLIDFGMGLNEARSQDIARASDHPHSCVNTLHNELKDQNKSKWETSFLAESNLICSTAQSNAAHFESAGLSRDDAELATFSAWLQLKKGDHSVTSISVADLESVVRNMGLLIVNSEPPEAEVTIDAKPCSTVTECRYWVTGGSHEIVISKRGYQSERTQETVTNGRATRVVKTLRH